MWFLSLCFFLKMAYYSTPRVTETAEGKTMDKEKPLYQLFWGEKLGNGSRGLPLISLILCCLKILKEWALQRHQKLQIRSNTSPIFNILKFSNSSYAENIIFHVLFKSIKTTSKKENDKLTANA